MLRSIIIGYDGTPEGDDAVALGRALARVSGAETTLVQVFPMSPFARHYDWSALMNGLPAAAHQPAEGGGAPEPVLSSSVTRGLHELAEERDADLVVVGSSRHGSVGEVLPGGTAIRLMHGSPCAVAVAPRGFAGAADGHIDSIVVGYDGLDEAKHALEGAFDLARSAGARLKLVAVAEPPPIIYGKGGGSSQGWSDLRDAIREGVQDRLDAALGSVPDDVEVEGALLEGAPAAKLAEVAAEEGDLIVIGSRGYGPLRRVLLGAVGTELLRSVSRPVIVFPRNAHASQVETQQPHAGASQA